MKVHFLGTAAAEGFPNVYCHCITCQKARELGGLDIRTRCSVIIDDSLKVDHGPDSYVQGLRDYIDMSLIQNLLLTHSHFDHLSAGDLISRMRGYAYGVEYPLNIYGNELAINKCLQALLEEGGDDEQNKMHRLEPFKTIEVGKAIITPLLADHDPAEMCFLFFIEKEGKNVLYGNDTGWFPVETWNWLKSKSIDLAILDCTTGKTGNKHERNHMSVETVLEMQKVFQRRKLLNESARTIVTHFSHNSGLLHEDLKETFGNSGIEVAYDGLIVDV